MKTQFLEPCIRTADALLSSINDQVSSTKEVLLLASLHTAAYRELSELLKRQETEQQQAEEKLKRLREEQEAARATSQTWDPNG